MVEWDKGRRREDGMDHAEKAKALFLLLARSDRIRVTGLELDEAARIASSFGGGIGRMREVCGTLSAAALILGYARGYSDPLPSPSGAVFPSLCLPLMPPSKSVL